jgi:hypothetical protein
MRAPADFGAADNATAAVVQSVADAYSIPVVCGGRQDSYDKRAQVDVNILKRGADTHILHIGDFDGQGLCICNTLIETIPDLMSGWDVMTGSSNGLPIVTFERFALRDMDQIREIGLGFAV